MALPTLTLINPDNDYISPSTTPVFSVKYDDLVDSLNASKITLELDRIGNFNTSVKQTQNLLDVQSGEIVSFTPAPTLTNGFWYWRITANNIDGSTISETRCIQISSGVLKRVLYQYENVAKYGPDWTKKRVLYQYENVAKYGPIWTRKRALYQYENITDDPPFPWIERLSATRAETGTVIEIIGNGFGAKTEIDLSNSDRSLRGYGGFVYIGNTLCNIISWKWQQIEFQIPDSAESGAVKVVLTSPNTRASNVIGLEVVQKFAEETGLELYVCDRTNPNTVVAYLDGATGKSFQSLLNAPGSGQFTISRYDLKGGDRDLIKDQNLILCKIGGRSIFKWIIESRNPQYVNSGENQEIQVSGRGVMSLLETAVVYPEGMPTPESLEREFVGVTGAAIIRVLILEAQARGALIGTEMDFTSEVDAIGNPWTDSTSISFHAGTPLLEVATRLGEGLGLFDFEMTPDLKLRLYQTKGTDKYNEIRYRPSQAIITHQNKSDASKVTNTVLVEGEGGAIVEAVHAEGQSGWGRREGYLQARNIKGEWAALQDYGNSYLKTAASAAWGIQGTVTGLLDDNGERLAPYRSYELGDWIGWLIPPEGTDNEGFDGKLRIKGITCQEDNDTAHLIYTLELNNIMLEHEIKMSQLVDRMAQFSRSTSLTSPSTQVNAPKNHNHSHSLLNGLDTDDHPQYLNSERHASDNHESVPRVSSLRKGGENELTGAIKLVAGANVSLAQNDDLKTITISALGGGGCGGIEIVTELPSTPSHGQTVVLYNDNYQYLATYHEPTARWYRVSLVASNYPWNNIYKPEALINLLFGDATKSIVPVSISTDFTTALRIKGVASTTKQLMWTFTSGEGNFAIWLGCETESISYDWANVYIDDVDISGKLGGTILSTYVQKALSAGSHTLKITYRKDGSGDVGYDGIQIYAISIP